MRKRNERRDTIKSIVRGGNIKTQRALVEELKALGYDCTQATISRDITEMGLRKLPEGVYALAEDLHLKRMVSDLVMDVRRSGNLVVVKATSGAAAGVAAALDAADLPGVVGSIAGDDTILAICEDEPQAIKFQDLLDRLRPGGTEE